MTARTMWKGVLHLPGAEIPVRLFAAAQDRSVHFRLLHRTDQTPVTQRMVHPDSGDEVPREEIRRGLEVDPGRFVVLRDEELAQLEPEPSRAIEVIAFVERRRVAAPWYDRPYWLGPDGDEEGYFALAAALARRDRLGIVQWTMRKQRYVGALRAEGPWLMMSSLKRLGEVVSREALGPPPEVRIDEREAQLARQLVATLEEPELDLSAFHDEHRERVLELIEAKAQGKRVKLKRPVERAEVVSLADSLERSIEAARGRRVA